MNFPSNVLLKDEASNVLVSLTGYRSHEKPKTNNELILLTRIVCIQSLM